MSSPLMKLDGRYLNKAIKKKDIYIYVQFIQTGKCQLLYNLLTWQR